MCFIYACSLLDARNVPAPQAMVKAAGARKRLVLEKPRRRRRRYGILRGKGTMTDYEEQNTDSDEDYDAGSEDFVPIDLATGSPMVHPVIEGTSSLSAGYFICLEDGNPSQVRDPMRS